MVKLTVGVLVLAASLAACSSSDDGGDIAASTLAGKIGGQAWTFQAGATDASLSDGETDFSATFSSAPLACNSPLPKGAILFVSVPRQVGEYDLSFTRNITFSTSASDNKVVVDGSIVIDSVTAATVTGRLRASYDGSNEVEGAFTVTICPDEQDMDSQPPGGLEYDRAR